MQSGGSLAAMTEPEYACMIKNGSRLSSVSDATPIESDHPAGSRDPGPSVIYARDRAGALVLIEVVPRATKSDLLVRLLAAMGTLQKLATQQVRGILIAYHFSDEIRHAARTLPTLELRTYQLTLSFAEA